MAEPRKTARSKAAASRAAAGAGETVADGTAEVATTAQGAADTVGEGVDTTAQVVDQAVEPAVTAIEQPVVQVTAPPPPAAPSPAVVSPPPAAPAPAVPQPPAATEPLPGAPVSSTEPAPVGAVDAQDGPPPGANVAAAISGLVTGIKERMSTAELLLGVGGLLVLGVSYLLLGFILDSFRQPTELAVLASVVLLVLMGLERSQRQGFGEWYRVALVVLGLVIAVGAGYSFLNTLRSGFSGLDLLAWLSVLAWWIGGVVAAVGAWMAFRARA